MTRDEVVKTLRFCSRFCGTDCPAAMAGINCDRGRLIQRMAADMLERDGELLHGFRQERGGEDESSS